MTEVFGRAPPGDDPGANSSRRSVLPLPFGAPSFHAPHQLPAPAVRRRVTDCAEHRRIGRLRELGISAENVGLHAFRHGLATELAESEPITVLQTQMRHADARTTLKVYAHVIPQSQRDSMERIARRSIGTNVPIGTGVEA